MDPAASTRWRRMARAVGYAVAFVVPLALLAFLVRTSFDPLVRLDQHVSVSATGYTRDHAGFHSLVDTWETISQPFVMYLCLGLPVSLYVWFARHRRTRAWWGLATMAAGWGIAALLKLLMHRARPVIDDPFSQHTGFSFPSGHATNNAIVVTVVLLMLRPFVQRAVWWLLVGLGALWVVLTCADRLFAGAHFLSDVVAGVILGCGLSAASYAGFTGWRPPVGPTTERSR